MLTHGLSDQGANGLPRLSPPYKGQLSSFLAHRPIQALSVSAPRQRPLVMGIIYNPTRPPLPDIVRMQHRGRDSRRCCTRAPRRANRRNMALKQAHDLHQRQGAEQACAQAAERRTWHGREGSGGGRGGVHEGSGTVGVRREHTEPSAVVYTDGEQAYEGMPRRHEAVNHSRCRVGCMGWRTHRALSDGRMM